MIRKLAALTIAFLAITLVAMASKAQIKQEPKTESLRANLLLGFTNAMATPQQFENTRVFHLLGYSNEEIAQIGRITPRPASMTVEFTQGEQPAEFSNIKVVCSQVSYYNLTIATATFEFPESALDYEELKNGNIRFTDCPHIKLKTEVSEQDILKVFEMFARAQSLQGLKLALTEDQARLDGWFRKGFLRIKFRITGKTELVNNKTVDFNARRLTLNRIPLPRNTTRSIIDRINPVFNASKTWLNLQIDKIKILNGFVETIARIAKKEEVVTE
jgi:hypothetical protein